MDPRRCTWCASPTDLRAVFRGAASASCRRRPVAVVVVPLGEADAVAAGRLGRGNKKVKRVGLVVAYLVHDSYRNVDCFAGEDDDIGAGQIDYRRAVQHEVQLGRSLVPVSLLARTGCHLLLLYMQRRTRQQSPALAALAPRGRGHIVLSDRCVRNPGARLRRVVGGACIGLRAAEVSET